MKFGLTKDEYLYIEKKVILPLKELEASIWCFGSRARGDFKEFSDLDILVSGCSQKLEKLVGLINEDLIESQFPYKVDIVFEDDLAKSYLEKIISDRIEL